MKKESEFSKPEGEPVMNPVKAIRAAQASWKRQKFDDMNFPDKHAAYITGFADGVESKPEPVIGERKYTLSEAMELVSKERVMIGANEAHAKDIRDAEEKGYKRAVEEMKVKINKMMFI